MPKMTDQELLVLVNSEFDNSMGRPSTDISLERAKNLSYYLARPVGDEEEGQSKVRSTAVSDVVDGIMPSLLRLFTTADNLVNFDAVGPEDVEKSDQESDYVNHVFFKKNPAFTILHTWFFDALVQRNGIVKAWWEKSEKVTTEEYEGLTEPEFLDLLGDEDLEAVERTERVEQILNEQGQPQEIVVNDVRFNKIVSKGRARVAPVPPEEFRISADSRSHDPSGARMVGQERQVTKSELLEMGFSKKIVNSLNTGKPSLSTEERSRRDKPEDIDQGSTDKSQDKFTFRECYINVDIDGDGTAQLRKVSSVIERVLEHEAADRQPFHVITPKPMPHQHFGRCPTDSVMDIADIESVLMQQTLNNIYHTNNPSHGVWEQGVGENTLDDILSTRVGSVTRFARPVGESWAPMALPFTADKSFLMLDYFDKAKRDRTGVSADSEGLSPEALKNIQTSVLAQATDISKMKVEAIARVFSETGIKSLFLHLHELLLKHQDKSAVFKLRNQFVEVNPAEWRERDDMTINIGLGIGTREQNLLHLNAIWEKQTQMVEGGGMNLTVSPKNIYNTASQIVRNANLKDPGQFFTDPGEQQAPPPSDQQQQLQAQAQQIEQRRQEQTAMDQDLKNRRLELDAREVQLKHEREMAELQRKREEDADDFAVAMDKSRNEIAKLSKPGAAN